MGETICCENVVLLSADALRADHLSCHGYSRKTSPNIDALADESVHFTSAYSVSSHTREAVPALLTGRYPDVAVDDNYHLVTDSIATTASEAGFATGGFHSNPFVSRAYGFDRGFDEFDDDLRFGRHKFIAFAQRALDKLRNRHYARASQINDRALSWVDSLDSGRPFFLWVHYMDTHGPYDPPTGYRTQYTDTARSTRRAQSLYHRAIKNPESITEQERRLLVDLYDAEIRRTDEQIGVLLDELHDRELLDRTLVVVTADHGDAFGEHGYYEHPRYLHDEVTHVPLLVRPPGGRDGTVSTPVSTLDVASTIAEATDLNHATEQPSLLSPSEDNRTVFLQARGEGQDAHIRRYALRTAGGACFCEYDRKAETLEFTDCTGRTLRSDLTAHVRERMQHTGRESDAEEEGPSEEIQRRLRALGYRE